MSAPAPSAGVPLTPAAAGSNRIGAGAVKVALDRDDIVSCIKALVERPATEPVPERWKQLMEEVPKDPWNREFVYDIPAKRSKGDYDVYSLGKDGVESDEDIGNWKLAKAN